jgi:membrane fusion protein (multidrug efflux system)
LPDSSSSEHVIQDAPARARDMRWLPNALALVLAAMLIAFIAQNWNYWVGEAGAQWTDDAHTQGDLTPLSALVAAPVLRVPVNDYQSVHQGDLLVELDPRIYAAQLAEAEAKVGAAQAAIGNLHAQEAQQQTNIQSAAAAISGAQATNWRNVLEANRQQALLRTGIVGTQQLVEQADAAQGLSTAQLAQAQAGLEAAKQQLAVLQSQEPLLDAELQAAQATRDLASINLGYTRITAPTDGVVSRRRVFPGQFVGIGSQVISVVPLPRLYVLANYRETQLTHVAPGQPAEIYVDAFPSVVLHGHVAASSPGTGAEFALLPPDNATGNYTKVVQRVPVKVVLDSDGGLGTRLTAGMSVEVNIHTGDRPR